METYIHSRMYKLRGSPAWKHTFTQKDIQVLWEPSINTRRYTSSVGVQHGNTHSPWIYKRPWESSMETHIHTREYTHWRGFGQCRINPWQGPEASSFCGPLVTTTPPRDIFVLLSYNLLL